MKKNFTACLIPVALFIQGCATPVPVAQNFPRSDQLVARTAHHWDVVAADIVSTTVNAIDTNKVLQNRPIFVPRFPDATSFEATFRDFLINHMVGMNMPVNVCSTSNASKHKTGIIAEAPEVQINYEARIIRHGFRMPDPHPGELAILAAGVAVLRGIFASDGLSSDLKVASGVAGIGALDWWSAYRAKPTRTELLITTTIAENNRFIMRRGDIYYVPDADARLFVDTATASRLRCPGEPTTTAASVHGEARDSIARYEMVEKAMRRTNPEWTWTTDGMMHLP